MGEMYGWTGKLLRVDLSSGQVSTMETAQYVPQFVGGMGVAARIAWDELKPVDALAPENMLFLMVGPLTGTLASGGGRVLVAGIAPQQKPSVFSRSSMGGHWGAELKYAGFDGVIVTGKAEKPVYLWVHDGQAEIRDAGELWGRGTYFATDWLRREHGSKTRVISIGQAGENLCRIACLQSETGNAAGQGGFGALMGSKNLKAVAVRGSLGVRVADPQRLLDVCLTASREGQAPRIPGQPPRMWQPSGHGLHRSKKCGFCITPCSMHHYMGVAGEATEGIYSATHQCWGYSTTPRGHTEARAMTADYGLNGWEISYGIIPWLQMCKQHGLINDFDGIDIPVPEKPLLNLNDSVKVEPELLNAVIKKIALRQGELGDALADGACYAGDKLFGGRGEPLLHLIYPRAFGQTNHWNGHWGTGGSPYFPFWLVPILQWCIDSRDPASDCTHQYTEHVLMYLPEHGPRRGPLTFEQARHVCQTVYGDPDCCEPRYAYDRPETKVLPAIWHHNRGMLVESLVLCDRENSRVFSMQTEDHVADTALMSKLFSAVTGCEVSREELDAQADGIFDLLRAVDIRFGRSREVDWAVAKDVTQPAFTDQVVLDLEQFGPMMDCYYQTRGWNPANGYPTREKLVSRGLADVADGLAAEGKLG